MLDFLRKFTKPIRQFPEQYKTFTSFEDFIGNFRVIYPSDWKFDEKVAVVDGAYTLSFESKNHKEKFIISVETTIPKKFNFKQYAKEKLIGPTSGVHATIKKNKFQKFTSYEIEYIFHSGHPFMCKTIIFSTKNRIFFISFSAPTKYWLTVLTDFNHMLDSLELLNKKITNV